MGFNVPIGIKPSKLRKRFPGKILLFIPNLYVKKLVCQKIAKTETHKRKGKSLGGPISDRDYLRKKGKLERRLEQIYANWNEILRRLVGLEQRKQQLTKRQCQREEYQPNLLEDQEM